MSCFIVVPGTHIGTTAISVGHSFVDDLDIAAFHPSTSTQMAVENSLEVSILFNLGRTVGAGITRAQFRQIMRRCALCRNMCLNGRQESHICHRKVSRAWKGGVQDFVNHLLSSEANTGLSVYDIRRELVSCGLCENICMARRLALHECYVMI